ncbi:hypothetical protein ScPMuIL_017850 [Solemya velum]
MRHEEHISGDDYQCPIGLKEVRVLGQLIEDVDSAAVRWSDQDTSTIISCFEAYFKEGISNKGKLPSKNEILEFLQTLEA